MCGLPPAVGEEEGAQEVWEGHNEAEKPQNTIRASGTAWWSHRKVLERSGRGRDERGGGGGVRISSASSAGSASGTGKVRPAREVVWKRQQEGSATRSATGGDRSYRVDDYRRGASSMSARRASVSIVGDVYTALRRRKEERVREARGRLGNGESVGLARKLLPVTWFAGAMRRRAVRSTLGDLTPCVIPAAWIDRLRGQPLMSQANLSGSLKTEGEDKEREWRIGKLGGPGQGGYV
ncbi:hypothetical protein B0H14DRAFT_2595087 [Mycena olivaceomarginata]|nr:hypothetical protein B0H14DRAFT_2595087 [Mycena olivaceomarginata]